MLVPRPFLFFGVHNFRVVFDLVAPGVGLRAGHDAGDIRIFITAGRRSRGFALLHFGSAGSLLLLPLLPGPLTGSLVLCGSRLVHKK